MGILFEAMAPEGLERNYRVVIATMRHPNSGRACHGFLHPFEKCRIMIFISENMRMPSPSSLPHPSCLGLFQLLMLPAVGLQLADSGASHHVDILFSLISIGAARKK